MRRREFIARGHRPMAPHVNFWIVARGTNIGLSTRMCFSDEVASNKADPVLNILDPISGAAP